MPVRDFRGTVAVLPPEELARALEGLDEIIGD
jgi:hypothetical protein